MVKFIERSIKSDFNHSAVDNGDPKTVYPVDLARFKTLGKTNLNGQKFAVDNTKGDAKVVYVEISKEQNVTSGFRVDTGVKGAEASALPDLEGTKGEKPPVFGVGHEPPETQKNQSMTTTKKRAALYYGSRLKEPAEYGREKETVNFHFDGDDINEDANIVHDGEANAVKLERLANYLKDNPTVSVKIAGHTDTMGTDAYNDDLSERRSESVLGYFESQGVPLRQLEVVSAEEYKNRQIELDIQNLGETQNVEDLGDEQKSQANRRVEIEIVTDDVSMQSTVVHNIGITKESEQNLKFSTGLATQDDAYNPAHLQFNIDADAARGNQPKRYDLTCKLDELDEQAFFVTNNGDGGKVTFAYNDTRTITNINETTGKSITTEVPDSRLVVAVDGKPVAIFNIEGLDGEVTPDMFNVGANTLMPDGTTHFQPAALGDDMRGSIEMTNLNAPTMATKPVPLNGLGAP